MATFCYRTFTVFGYAFQHIHKVHHHPISLAATYGVAYCFPFLWVLRCFSSPGLPRTPMHSVHDTLAGGFPHSDIYRSQPGYRLPIAFRRFQRPSSPLDAKSSTVCPSWFDQSDLMPIRRSTTTRTFLYDLPCLPARYIDLLKSSREGKRFKQAPFQTHLENFSVSIFAELSLMNNS